MTNMSCEMISKRVIIVLLFLKIFRTLLLFITLFFSLWSIIILLYYTVYLFIFAFCGSLPVFILNVICVMVAN